MIDETIIDFLRESNNIENIWDDDSLAQAIFAWNYLISQKELTPSVILKTHKILMLHQRLRPDERGNWRKEQVWVGHREGRPWYMVPNLIANWCKSSISVQCNPKLIEEDIKKFHIEYETIHPFIDGNGRTGRMFLNYQRIKNNLPILVVKECEKQEYYKWFP